MKFTIEGPLKDNVYNFMRGLGYHFVGKSKDQYNFIKPIGGDAFPRYDVYLETENGNLLVSLHIDQKRPIYSGQTAHQGEYDGELIGKEAERIKNFANNS